jgi:hypothetical protein
MQLPIIFSFIVYILVGTPTSAYKIERLFMAQITALVKAMTLVKASFISDLFLGIALALAAYQQNDT